MTRALDVEAAIRAIDARGEYPSPGRIQKELGERVTHDINGRDLKVRDRVFRELGYTRSEGLMFGRSWVKR